LRASKPSRIAVISANLGKVQSRVLSVVQGSKHPLSLEEISRKARVLNIPQLERVIESLRFGGYEIKISGAYTRLGSVQAKVMKFAFENPELGPKQIFDKLKDKKIIPAKMPFNKLRNIVMRARGTHPSQKSRS